MTPCGPGDIDTDDVALEIDALEDDALDEDALDAHPLVRIVRSDPESEFYDPRYARPVGAPPTAGWGEIDTAVLDEARAPVPAFPLDVLPTFWRDWVEATARAVGAPVDYVAQSLLAAVAALCGGGAVVRVGPRWSEPLVLWQAMVGPPSSAKSPAMAPLRELLATLDAEKTGEEEEPRRAVVSDASLAAVAEAVAANPRGVIVWRDDLPEGLMRPADTARRQWLQGWAAGPVAFGRGEGAGLRSIDRFAVSLLLAMVPDRVSELFAAGEELAGRFLYAWPPLPEHSPLADARPAPDAEALAALRRIARKARPPSIPLELIVDGRGLGALDDFLGALQRELREAEGLDMAWLGKGRGTAVRLAGILQMLAWSESGAPGAPGHLGSEEIERGVRLWSGYFRPHALALFHRSAPSDGDRRARRVVRWLRDRGVTEFSREQVRLEALNRSVNAAATDGVLARLQAAGLVERVSYATPSRGRPPNRWLVNPRLATRPSVGNAGNAGKSPA
ncbi:DUF3987 domain-containing protein [Reyranella sp.]|uniref:DUF3987 domain-containing protein n=1 Tax=Reyranella sp. TaxID=1929291 RepID=UPI003BAD339C